MASNPYATTIQSDNARAAIAEVKTLTVDRLKKILRAETLTVSGVKSELQFRLINHIEQCAAIADFARIDRVRSAIKGVTGFANPYPSPYSNHTPASSLSPQFTSPTPRNPPPLSSFPMASYGSNRLNFRSSPFYTVIRSLSPVTELKVREQTRDTGRINLRLDPQTIDQLHRDPNVRVMVFGAAENLTSNRYEPCDIAFPQHGELKCNSDDVKHNLKGIKGKPGTTRPADITQYIRKATTFTNQVDLVYALTTKKYFLVVNLVQKKSIEKLVSEIKLRRTPYLKDRVVKEMRSKAEDADIVATSTNMSLKDPLQMTRIQVPCRGLSCRHNGCFDAAVYLALQEQAPTWTCPICHKPTAWDNIAYDEYFDDILRHVDSDAEQVTIEPDGTWRKEDIVPSEQNQGDGSGDRSLHDDYDDFDDEDDIIEITDSRASGPGKSRDVARTPTATTITTTTPSVNSASLTPAPLSASSTHSYSDSVAAAARSNKRPHSETIDLTLDDSEDDQPPISRIKRSSMSSQPSDPFRARPPQPEPYRFQMPPPSSSSSSSYGQHHYSGF